VTKYKPKYKTILFSSGIGISEKLKNLPRLFLRPKSTHAFQVSYNPSRDPVPLTLQENIKNKIKLSLEDPQHCLIFPDKNGNHASFHQT
jgi:hypothetical protein